MSISPLLPGVSLVIHPRLLSKGLVGNCGNQTIRLLQQSEEEEKRDGLTARRSRVDLQEARPTCTPITAAYDSSSQTNFSVPRYRVESDVSGRYRHVEIVPPLRMLIHVAAKDLGLVVIDIFVKIPD